MMSIWMTSGLTLASQAFRLAAPVSAPAAASRGSAVRP
jgi:hypothetical protein